MGVAHNSSEMGLCRGCVQLFLKWELCTTPSEKNVRNGMKCYNLPRIVMFASTVSYGSRAKGGGGQVQK